MTDAPADWTSGVEAVVLQSCDGCGHRWLFTRSFCPRCGRPDPAALRSGGRGRLVARTQVHRAATAEARAHVPYVIVLVDLDEGVRMMGHGVTDLVIGEEVVARFATFAGRLVPFFVRAHSGEVETGSREENASSRESGLRTGEGPDA